MCFGQWYLTLCFPPATQNVQVTLHYLPSLHVPMCPGRWRMHMPWTACSSNAAVGPRIGSYSGCSQGMPLELPHPGLLSFSIIIYWLSVDIQHDETSWARQRKVWLISCHWVILTTPWSLLRLCVWLLFGEPVRGVGCGPLLLIPHVSYKKQR